MAATVFWVAVPRSMADVFRRTYLLPPSSGQGSRANTSETSVKIYRIKRHNNPENSHLQGKGRFVLTREDQGIKAQREGSSGKRHALSEVASRLHRLVLRLVWKFSRG